VAPNLIGLPLERARAQAQAVGLVLAEPTLVQTDRLPEATVIEQDPAPGAAVASGDTIEISVSTARGTVVIPDVAGMAAADAIVALTSAGLFVAATTDQPDADVPRGVVIATEPAAGREVAFRAPVMLIVSSGRPLESAPPPTTTPTSVPSAPPPPESPATTSAAPESSAPASPTTDAPTPSP
jgi:beta-lactam-binding protein with PASTA domain